VTPLEFHWDLWHQKTRVPWLSYVVICVILCLAVFVQCRLVMDRRTDGRIGLHDDSIYRASIASRGKNAAKTLNNSYRLNDSTIQNWIHSGMVNCSFSIIVKIPLFLDCPKKTLRRLLEPTGDFATIFLRDTHCRSLLICRVVSKSVQVWGSYIAQQKSSAAYQSDCNIDCFEPIKMHLGRWPGGRYAARWVEAGPDGVVCQSFSHYCKVRG